MISHFESNIGEILQIINMYPNFFFSNFQQKMKQEKKYTFLSLLYQNNNFNDHFDRTHCNSSQSKPDL